MDTTLSPTASLTAAGGIALRADGLTKCYGSRLAVDRLSFALPAGTVTGFVGPNGAGKTTTMRMLLGLVRPTTGTASIQDIEIGRRGALRRVGSLIEGPAFYPSLSARRNLRVLATVGDIDPRRIDAVLATVDLADRAGDRVGGFSLGMKQRLGIAAALLPDPDVVLLDEPTNGLDPAGIRDVRDLLRRLADRGATVLVSSHLMTEIEQVCDRLMVIHSGRLVFDGGLAELAAHRQAELWACPESPTDLDRLVDVLAAQGLAVRREDGGVRVEAAVGLAAPVNRAAFEADITLAELRAEVESLEPTIVRMLGLAGEVAA